jgi:hypothetical protein
VGENLIDDGGKTDEDPLKGSDNAYSLKISNQANDLRQDAEAQSNEE